MGIIETYNYVLKVSIPLIITGIVYIIDCYKYKALTKYCKKIKFDYSYDNLAERYSEKHFNEIITKTYIPVDREKKVAKNKFRSWRNIHVFNYIVGILLIVYLLHKLYWICQILDKPIINSREIDQVAIHSGFFLTELFVSLRLYGYPLLKILKQNTMAQIINIITIILQEILEELNSVSKTLINLFGIAVYLLVAKKIFNKELSVGKQIALYVFVILLYNNVILHFIAGLVAYIRNMICRKCGVVQLYNEYHLLYKGLRESTYLILVTFVFVAKVNEINAPLFEAIGISFLYDTYFDKHPLLLKVVNYFGDLKERLQDVREIQDQAQN